MNCNIGSELGYQDTFLFPLKTYDTYTHTHIYHLYEGFQICWYCLLTVSVAKERLVYHVFPQNTMLFPHLLNLLVLPVIVNFEQIYIWCRPCPSVPLS